MRSLQFKPIAFFFLVLPILTFCEDYIAFPTDSAVWTIEETWEVLEPYRSRSFQKDSIRYFLHGDTTLDSVVYSKVYEADTREEGLLDNASLIGYLRETEAREIYFRHRKTASVEVKLYDFNLSLGDTVVVNDDLSNTQDKITYKVNRVDNVNFAGTNRKRYELFPFGAQECVQYWIEGIGNSEGLFRTDPCIQGISTLLIDFSSSY